MECGAKEYKKLEKALRESANAGTIYEIKLDRWGAAKFCEGWARQTWEYDKVKMDFVKVMEIISKLREEGLVE